MSAPAPITLQPEDVYLAHEGRRCWVEEIYRGADVRCPHCGTNLADAQDVTTTHGRTNAGGTYGEVEVDMTITCDCGEQIAARIRWDDI